MKQVQKVWAELSAKAQEVETPQESTELSEEKVELALIDDLRARAGAIQKDMSNLISMRNEFADMKRNMQKWVSSLSDTVSAQQKEINKASQAMDELGVDKSSLKYYNDQVGEVLQELKQAQGLIK